MYYQVKPFRVYESEFGVKQKRYAFSLIADLHLKNLVMLEQAHLTIFVVVVLFFLTGIRFLWKGTSSAKQANSADQTESSVLHHSLK